MPRAATIRPARARAPRGSARPPIEVVPNAGAARVHLVLPRSFNDAQQIADKFKQSIPVILNLQNADSELSKRLIDFASGLTYALNGGMQRVADKVFLLTPRNVEVSAEQRAQLLERGGFFNQAWARVRGPAAQRPRLRDMKAAGGQGMTVLAGRRRQACRRSCSCSPASTASRSSPTSSRRGSGCRTR